MRPAIRLLLLGALLGPSALRGQEAPRQPEPDRVLTRRLPPGSLDGQVQIITTRRARIGISLDLRPRDDDSLGALIQSVTPNGPAARAGLRSGDIIATVNRQAIARPLASLSRDVSAAGLRLIELMTSISPGDTLAIEYRRGTDRRNTSVIAGEEPAITWHGPDGAFGYWMGEENPAAAEAMRRSLQGDWLLRGDLAGLPADSHRSAMAPRMPAPMLLLGTPFADLELAPMNPGLGQYFGTDNGVLVVNLPPDSRLGLKPGDVVLSVDGRTVMGPGHLVRVLRSYGNGETFRLKVVRMKKRETITGQVAE